VKSGFNGYITKPIDPQLFVRQIENHLPARKRVDQAVGHDVGLAAPVPRHAAARGVILVLDNSAVNRQLLRDTLEPSGFTVMTAETAQQALSMACSLCPHLIISDMHMPGLSGLDFLKAVKADSQLRNVRFIFLTSSIWSANERAAAESFGVDRFIVRPIDPHQLLSEIDSCLDNKKGNDHGQRSDR
jgi:two-component system cell cycle response regulator